MLKNCKKFDKLYGGKLHFKDINFPVKVRETHKIKRKKSHQNWCFCLYKNIKSMCKKSFADKYVDLLLIGERKKALFSDQRF